MAKSSTAKVSEVQNPPATGGSDVGFVDESRPDIAGWVKPTEGLYLHGVIVGAFTFLQTERGGARKRRDVIAVRLLEECVVVKDKVNVTAEAGQVVGLGLNHATGNLRYYVDGKAEFKLRFLAKENIGGGHTAWKAKLACKGRKAANPWMGSVQTVEAPEEMGNDDSDIPF